MSGFFGVASKENCVLDLFFGVDYHSHLGTRRAGMAVYGDNGYKRAIHSIENTPFRTKFDKDLDEFDGHLGIGCISDDESQPLLLQSHLGSFGVTTVGRINNMSELVALCYGNGMSHFMERSTGGINPTELVAALINQKASFVEGIKYVQDVVKGSMSLMVLTPYGVYCARDKLGRTPIVIGKKDTGFCATFESSAYMNLGYEHYRDLGPGEIVLMSPDRVDVMREPLKDMKICSFLWVYYGYPTSTYEGINVEVMRNRCGEILAKRDINVDVDYAAGVPDSGVAHAVGYANEKHIHFARPFIKYTPTWPRSFMPSSQKQRKMIAKMKLIPVKEMIKDKKMLLIDDSIVRGTQLANTADFLFETGAKEVHVRPACPPILFGCKYLNFSRSSSEMDLITRRIIRQLEGDNISKEILKKYADPTTEEYSSMCEEIRKFSKFTTLKFHRLDDLVESIGLPKERLCTYCFDGEE